MRNRARVATIVLAALAGGLGCRHATPPATTAAPAAPAEQAARVEVSGSVGMSFLTTPGTRGPVLAEHQEFVAPRSMAMPLPAFPADTLAADAPPATVVVRIVVGTDGRVVQVGDSPVAASTSESYAAPFRAAVETALAKWDFYPGFIDTVKDGLDGDGRADYTVLLNHQAVPVTYDVGFEFRMVDGDGVVTPSIRLP